VTTREQIETTLYSYAWGFDQEALDVLEGCFAQDARLVIHGNAIEGRTAIVEHLGKLRAARREADERMRHVMSNVLVHEHGDGRATVTSYFTTFMQTAPPSGTLQALGTGFYRDQFVEAGDRWLMAEREVHFDRD
jgi:3-phenylpropionate/cinnamic acid dioxygenase small subunit